MRWIPATSRTTSPTAGRYTRLSFAVCIAITLFTAIVPVFRAFFPMQLEYNEGWNVNNAAIVAQHHLLYPVRFGWTTVNYPMLSFSVVAALHHVTGDYLFTARALSLFGLLTSSLLVAAIVRQLGANIHASILSGLLCFALFCADASMYVGIDDPQMFAQTFYLLGVFLYVRNRTYTGSLAATALLFVIGGFIKHNLVDIPIAVLIDLLLLSLPSALLFALCGLLFAALGILLNSHFGGPYFLSQLITRREYAPSNIRDQFLTVWGPLLPILAYVLYAARTALRNPRQRIAVLLFATAVVIGGYFSGGVGVSINSLFSSLIAAAILLGLLFDHQAKSASQATDATPRSLLLSHTAIIVFLLLSIPLIVSGNERPLAVIRQTFTQQRQFDNAVAYLKTQPGPALCEDLLLCYDAQKPYIYDPFNATRLIHEQKLSAGPLIAELQRHTISAVQLDEPLDTCISCRDRFSSQVLLALRQNYVPALRLQDAVIYTPKTNLAAADAVPSLAASHRHHPSSSHALRAASTARAGSPSHPARG